MVAVVSVPGIVNSWGDSPPVYATKKEEPKFAFRICMKKTYIEREQRAQTSSVGDPVVLDRDGGSVPANGDGGGCGRRDLQISGSVRD